jgi:UDP-N-acetylglucosamine transferase subunit ALG13
MTTFVSVGNGHQDFSRLLNEVKRIAPNLPQPVIVQHGRTPFESDSIKHFAFVDSAEFGRLLRVTTLIITHGGAGSVFRALKLGKRPVVVPRQHDFNEHVDDHQVTFVNELAQAGLVVGVIDIGSLEKAVAAALTNPQISDDLPLPVATKALADIGGALNRHAPRTSDKIALVTPPGGHLNEIEYLSELYSSHPHFYVTNMEFVEPPHMRGLVHVITHSSRDWRFLINLKEAFHLLRREKPRVILTTGGGFSVAFTLIGRVLRIPTIYIETAGKVGTPTATGRIMYWLTRDFFYQWPQVGRHFPRGTCVGLLI